MDKNILDASVVIKWFFQEAGSDSADFYLEKLSKRELVICVPELLFYEVGNTLISKGVSINDSDSIAKELLTLPFKKRGMDSKFFTKIVQNAKTFNLTFYDASYVTLTQEERCGFITADKKLFEKIHKKFKRVRLLSN